VVAATFGNAPTEVLLATGQGRVLLLARTNLKRPPSWSIKVGSTCMV
jgi:hypothetical protein